MKLRKAVILIFITFISILLTSICNISNAAVGDKYFSAKSIQRDNYSYRADEKTIWRIYETNSTSNTPKDEGQTIFCLHRDVGLGADFGSSTPTRIEYDRFFNFRDDGMLEEIQKALPSFTEHDYKRLVWLFDHAYIAPKDSSEEEVAHAQRKRLLEAAGISDGILTEAGTNVVIGSGSDVYFIDITDEEIDDIIGVIQQMIVWHIVGDYDSSTTLEIHRAEQGSLTYRNFTEDTSFLERIGDVYGTRQFGEMLNAEVDKLYTYLVSESDRQADSYNIYSNSQRVTFSDTNSQIVKNGSNYIAGPFRLEKSSNLDYSMELSVSNNGGVVNNYKLLNNNQQEVGSNITIKDLVGSNFYISVPNTVNVETLSLSINGTYNGTEAIYWTVSGRERIEQPIAVLDSGDYSFSDATQLTYIPQNFDLALRKFTTKINNVELKELDGTYTREPDANINPLVNESDTTAEYRHVKNPIQVNRNDEVTYTIRVYNEGNIDGYVNEITDHLPEQLEFIEGDSLNISYGWELQSDGRTVTTDITSLNTTHRTEQNNLYGSRTNGTLLKTFDGSNLDYIEVQIKCRVKNTDFSGVITNIAQITDFSDSNGNEIEDIDSQENNLNLPSDTNLPDYKGNTSNKNDLTDSNYHYEGQEDDDDFEKLILPAATGSYNLQLLKVDSKDEGIKLEGATFRVTLPDGSSRTLTTNSEGLIELGQIDIRETGTDIIRIEEQTAPDGYNILYSAIEVEVTKGLSALGNYVATNVRIGQVTGTGISDSGSAKVNLSNNMVTITVPNNKREGSYELELLKVDSKNTNTELEGAEFKVTLPDGTEVTETTDANGIIDLGQIAITETGTDVITIEETKAPEGYNKLFDRIEVTVTKELTEEGTYEVTKAEITNTTHTNIEDEAQVEASISRGVLTVTIPNNKQEGSYNVQLIKVDSKNEETRLQGARFRVTLPSGTTRTLTTNKEGIIDIGQIEIEEVGTDIIKLEETAVPSGYNIIFSSIEIEVTKELTAEGKYEATNVEVLTTEKTEVEDSAEVKTNISNGIITVTVPNNKQEGSYNLQLVKVDSRDENIKLEGAEFKITLEDGSSQTLTTNSEGIIEIKDIKIEDTTQDRITIEETKAPEGYNKLFDSIVVAVSKTLADNGRYEVSRVSIVSSDRSEISDSTAATVEVNNGIITVTVPNKKPEGSYNLELTKVDSGSSTRKLEGAEFKITLPDGSSQTIATDESGIINIGPINIEETGTDTIKVEETKAPEGYNKIFNSIEISAIKVLNRYGDYEIDNAEIANVEKTGIEDNKEASISLTNDTIKLTVPNNKRSGSYNLQIVKVDGKDINTKLRGAKFNVTYSDNSTQLITTNVNGIANFKTINIEAIGTETLIIEEQTTPTGYNKLFDTLEVTVTKEVLENGKFGITNAEITKINGEEVTDELGITISINGEVVTLTIPNYQPEGNYKLQLVKVDSKNEETKLEGAEFKATFEDGSSQTLTTNSEGLIDFGKINITETGIDTIKVEEITAPKGYTKLFESFEIDVTKELTKAGDYQASQIDLKNATGTTANTGEEVKANLSDGLITLTVPNKKQEGNYNLQLVKIDSKNEETKLEGAEFKVTFADGSSRTLTTNREGLIDFGKINITETGIDTIKVEEITAPNGYTKLFESFEIDVVKELTEAGDYQASQIDLKNATGTTANTGEEVKANLNNGLITITVPNKKQEGNYSLQLVKVDSKNEATKLEEAEFKVTFADGSSQTLTTNSEGIIDFGQINITEVGTDTIKVEEITAPNGYTKLFESFEIDVTKELTEAGDYQATQIDLKNATGTTANTGEEVKANLNNGLITITVPNKKQEGNYSLQLVKVDSKNEETKLEGAKFKVTFADGSSRTLTTNSEGLIDFGQINITETGTDTIKVEEITAPNGYTKLFESFEIDVAKELTAEGNYQIANASLKGSTGTVANTGEEVKVGLSGNAITITVANKKQEGNYSLQLVKVDSKDEDIKLEGAEFKVTFADGSNQTLTTNSEGLIDFGQINITEIGTDTIKVEEITAPKGYTKLFESFEIDVTKELTEAGDYQASQIDLKNATGTTENTGEEVKVGLSGNAITITVPNKKQEGNYSLQLVKVDSTDENIKLEGAEFKVTFADGSSRTLTTNSEGIIDFGKIDITEVGTDTIKVEEITAPTGYTKLFESFEIDVTKELTEAGNYQVSQIDLKNATGTTENSGEEVKANLNNGLITLTVPNKKEIIPEGSYKLQIVKVDNENEDTKLEGAEFKITLPDGTEVTETTDANGMIDLGQIDIEEIGTDVITIEEITAPTGYDKLFNRIEITVTKELTSESEYNATRVEITNVEGTEIVNGEEVKVSLSDKTVTVTVPNKLIKKFDLSLRKFITSVNGEDLVDTDGSYTREPEVDVGPLVDGNEETTTAIYNHPKTPVEVELGDTVTYTIRVYNEGEVDGYVREITDHLPPQLEYLPDDELNLRYGWVLGEDGRTVTTDITSPDTANIENQNEIYANRTTETDKVLLKAFDGSNLDYIDVQIRCRVRRDIDITQKITNIAEITESSDSEGEEVPDIDSDEDNVDLPSDENLPGYKDEDIESGDEYIPGQEDDDDFEKLIPKQEKFDLSLRKFITAVNENELKETDGSYTREPEVDVGPLVDENEETTTAIYNHTKTPVEVNLEDIVTYTIRVYNEGEIDGYVREITDHLPPQLEYLPDDELNIRYGWELGEDGRTVTTDITSPDTANIENQNEIYANRRAEADKVLLKAFDGSNLDYIDVQIRCRVRKDIDITQKITNIAEITGSSDSEGQEVEDIDSDEDNVDLPSDEDLPGYKDENIESGDEYIPGQEDDDDFEKLIPKIFDLALRKFITGVNDQEITNRVPIFTIDENGNYVYEHTKEPVEVATGYTVIYTLRIFNEGNVAGYAELVKDDIPEGLEFLPENEINIENRWKMYREDGTETDNPSEASYIETDYLSKAQEEETGRDNLLDAFNPEEMTQPDYRDIRIAFRVTEPNTSDRIIINSAQISEDSDEEGNPVEDEDSEPDEWNEGEDDQDIEKIKVQYYDMALRKWVTESIVTYNGKTTVTQTGHTAYMDPESPAKVEIRGSRMENTTVKFRFSIMVVNEGEIAGKIGEITDYIPEGLRFVQEDNPEWREVGENIVVTDQLKDTVLEPGESATVEIVLTWISSKENLGLMTNWAEISEDDGDDIDSTPDNREEGEDDIDSAPVIISIVTGATEVYTYIGLAAGVLAILSGGVILIKKFVI